MEITDPRIDRYLHDLAAPKDPVLLAMERAAVERDFPIVGRQVGRLLFVLARATGATRILELGSGFGYSGYWFASAVAPEGTVVLTESSAENAREASVYLARGGLAANVRIEHGDAFEIAARLTGPFDIVFNDVDKEDYPRVIDAAARLLRPGGLLISDNMLWYGRVLDDATEEPATRGVQALTRALHAPRRFFTAIVPLRDGLSVSVRLPDERP
jgi:predicted O-methyltransferase YrrM